MAHRIHPNSLRNLEANQWQPGQSGNPEGRRTAGACVAEAMNSLINKPAEYVRQVADGEIEDRATLSWRIAAFRVLDAMKPSKNALGATEFLADRTAGKPTVQAQITVTDNHPDRGLAAEILRALGRSAELPEQSSGQLPQLPAKTNED